MNVIRFFRIESIKVRKALELALLASGVAYPVLWFAVRAMGPVSGLWLWLFIAVTAVGILSLRISERINYPLLFSAFWFLGVPLADASAKLVCYLNCNAGIRVPCTPAIMDMVMGSVWLLMSTAGPALVCFTGGLLLLYSDYLTSR